jgi:aspartate/methionine/tyrosine aminotransferase
MRRNLVHSGAGQLRYEIREIVQFARELEGFGVRVTWENIGDPVAKGEKLPDWIKGIVSRLASEDPSYAYSDTQGHPDAREFIASKVNERGGARIGREDVVFFNGLGDAVSKVFGFLRREARVLGPSPAYSTLSSAEAAHSGYEHLSYRLDPANDWMPDLEDIEHKVRYNDSIAGILLINPDNPTGAVYPRETLKAIVDIARKHDVFLICDETYAHIVYNGGRTVHLSEVIGEVPGLSLRSISKEFPWPGARCGWAEFYNLDKDENFRAYAKSLVDAKRLEVCSTSLPQMAIPLVMADPRYVPHLEARKRLFESRANQAYEAFSGIPGVRVTRPKGALYFTVLFEEGFLREGASLPVSDSALRAFIEERARGLPLDKRFVYWLLASTGICVVPLSGFASSLPGFRMTLLESDDAKRAWIIDSIASALRRYGEDR